MVMGHSLWGLHTSVATNSIDDCKLSCCCRLRVMYPLWCASHLLAHSKRCLFVVGVNSRRKGLCHIQCQGHEGERELAEHTIHVWYFVPSGDSPKAREVSACLLLR
jgi:hypothetical protein